MHTEWGSDDYVREENFCCSIELTDTVASLNGYVTNTHTGKQESIGNNQGMALMSNWGDLLSD